jgi:hypothetical protein
MTSLNDFENLTKQIDKQFEGVNKRLDRIDSHLEKLDGRLWTAFFTITIMILGIYGTLIFFFFNYFKK